MVGSHWKRTGRRVTSKVLKMFLNTGADYVGISSLKLH